MKTSRIVAAAIVLLGLAGCNCGGPAVSSGDTGDPNNPIDYPDGGSGATVDSGFNPGVISVTCQTAQTVVPVNTAVDITCAVDTGGRSVTAPALSASPADGVVLVNGTQLGAVVFSLSTHKAGYTHSLTFQDTVVTVTVEVRNVANAAEFGRGRVSLTVLGNYWIGDSNSTGQGIYIYASDGSNIGQAVGPAGIKGVTGMVMLPTGDIAAASQSAKEIKIFDRQGTPQAPAKFDDTDQFNGKQLWGDVNGNYGGPRAMAVASNGDLWVTGGYELTAGGSQGTPGIAVFNPKSGALIRFVPHPDPIASNQFIPTSIARRSDGVMVASADVSRDLCMFNELTGAPSAASCTTVDNPGYCDYSALLALPNARLITGPNCTTDGNIMRLSPTLAIERKSDDVYHPSTKALVVSGGQLIALGSWGNTVGSMQLIRFDLANLTRIAPDWTVYTDTGNSKGLWSGAGLVRLVPPGN